MNQWIKLFNDGTQLVCDQDNISFSKTRLDNMHALITKCNNINVAIVGLGNYWQADKFMVSASTGETKHLMKFIEKEISQNDRCIMLRQNSNELSTEFVFGKHPIENDASIKHTLLLNNSHIGKWFIVELDLTNNMVSHYISDYKI